jgi:DNA-binding transcriptional MerR regulator
MSNGTLAIGMFSRASSISIKALRAYHEAGILVPARVDPDSGYRIYAADQLADAAIVARLRALDVPLAQVKEILHGRDPELTRRILEAHQTQMRQRLADTQRIIEELQSGVAPVTHTPVHVRDEPARDTVRMIGHVTPDTYEAWLTHAFDRLAACLDAAGVRAAGPPGTLWAPEILLDEPERVEAFIPVGEPVANFIANSGRDPDIAVGELPAASVAVLVHPGEYTAMPDTYRTLGAWVARNARYAGGPIREWCVVGPGRVAASAYRTEIAWPISRSSDQTHEIR